MKIDLSKLQNVKHLSGGKTTAQCPACAADGGDAKREHLAIFADGKFGCVVHPKDKEHNRAILKLVGTSDRGDGGASCRLSVTPVRVEDSRVLMKVGRLGRVKPSPEEKHVEPTPADSMVVDQSASVDQLPPPVCKSGVFVTPRSSPEISDPKLREFLDLAA